MSRDSKKQLFEGIEAIPFDFWGQPVYLDDSGTPQCPGYTGNIYATNLWDYVQIGDTKDDLKTPGIADVRVHKYRDLDKKKAAGTDGARLTIHGLEPALFEIRIKIWTPAQWVALVDLWGIIFPGPQKVTTTKTVYVNNPVRTETTLTRDRFNENNDLKAQTVTIPQVNPDGTTKTKKIVKNTSIVAPIRAFDLLHPEFRLHHVKSGVFLRGEGPDPGPEPRSRVFTINGIEFLKPGKNDAAATLTAAQPQKTLFSKDGYQTPGASGANTGFGSVS